MQKRFKVITSFERCIQQDGIECYSQEMEELILSKFGKQVINQALLEAKDLYAIKEYKYNLHFQSIRLLKLLVVALLVSLYYESRAQTISKDLTVFLKKFGLYAQDHKVKVKRNVPIAKLEGVTMSNTANVLEAFMEDAKTGLRFYSKFKHVYDPETGYYLEYDY